MAFDIDAQNPAATSERNATKTSARRRDSRRRSILLAEVGAACGLRDAVGEDRNSRTRVAWSRQLRVQYEEITTTDQSTAFAAVEEG